MSVSAQHLESDRSDFRTVATAGVRLGLLTAAAVMLYIYGSRLVGAGMIQQVYRLAVVLAGATAVTFLPGQWVGARSTQGIAGAAAVGLVGTVVFTLTDVILLRAILHLYPWTWDAVGGGSGWWYLPVWWMYGTLLPWLGAIVIAGKASSGEASPLRVALPVLGFGLVLLGLTRLFGWHMPLAVAGGGGFTVALVVVTLAALVRRT